jgi:hypothetical protein
MAKKNQNHGSETMTGNAVFESFEMKIQSVDGKWNSEKLLAQEGIFHLNPVARKLGLDAARVRKKYKECRARGGNPWQEMGVSKVLAVWMVNMPIFAPYYRGEKSFKIQVVEPEWDGNYLLTRKGLFFLTDVCEKIPFTPHQFRHQVRTNPQAEKEFGVWWDKDLKHYIVRMERFSKYIVDLWKNHPYGFE